MNRKETDRNRQSSTNKPPYVFIGGIPLTSTRMEIQSFLEKFDRVAILEIPTEKKTNKLKGYAKAQLQTTEGVDRLLAEKAPTIRGLAVGVKVWTNKSDYLQTKDEASNRKIFIRHHPKLAESQLHEFFSQFGSIDLFDFKVCPKTGKPRNFTYIVYSAAESASLAALHGNGDIDGKYVRSEVTTPSYLISQARKLPKGSQACSDIVSSEYKDTSASLAEFPKKRSYKCRSIESQLIEGISTQQREELQRISRDCCVNIKSYRHRPQPACRRSQTSLAQSKLLTQKRTEGKQPARKADCSREYPSTLNSHLLKPTSSNYLRTDLESNHQPENLAFSSMTSVYPLKWSMSMIAI